MEGILLKRYTNFLVVLVLMVGCLLWTGTEMSWANEEFDDGIYPNSFLYSFERFGERLKENFLSDEEKVDFYLELSVERFTEAKYMYTNDESDKAYDLFKEGLSNVGKALQAWTRCLEEDIDMEGVKEDLQSVLADAKETFKQLKKDFNLSKITEISKDIADLVKEQVRIFLNMGND